MDKRSSQEEKPGAFFDNIENKKEKSAKTRRIISRIIRLIIPLFFPFLYSLIANIVLYTIPLLKDDFGITIIFFCTLFFVPIYCIIYGISVASNEKRKYLFALYNPIVSCWYLFLNRSYSFAFFSFVWLLIWTFVPLGIYNHNHNSETDEEAPSVDKAWKAIKIILYLFVTYFISALLQRIAFSNSIDIFVGYAILLILFFVLFPLASFFYSKIFISKSVNKWLRLVICPIFLVMSYVFSFPGNNSFSIPDNKTFLISLTLFVWCEIWSLIGINRK